MMFCYSALKIVAITIITYITSYTKLAQFTHPASSNLQISKVEHLVCKAFDINAPFKQQPLSKI